MENRKQHNMGFLSQMMYGIDEFFNGGVFVIINTFFIAFMTDAIGIPCEQLWNKENARIHRHTSLHQP